MASFVATSDETTYFKVVSTGHVFQVVSNGDEIILLNKIVTHENDRAYASALSEGGSKSDAREKIDPAAPVAAVAPKPVPYSQPSCSRCTCGWDDCQPCQKRLGSYVSKDREKDIDYFETLKWNGHGTRYNESALLFSPRDAKRVGRNDYDLDAWEAH